MQATSNKAQIPDIAAQVTYAMRIMGISPLPRNYELYYEAYIGSNPKLTKELAALGSRATQEELDEIGARYFSHLHPAGLDRVHNQMARELTDLLSLLREEQFALENYNRVLDETYRNISNKSTTSADLLRQAVGILSEATVDTMNQAKKRAENVTLKSFEMEIIRQELDEYK